MNQMHFHHGRQSHSHRDTFNPCRQAQVRGVAHPSVQQHRGVGGGGRGAGEGGGEWVEVGCGWVGVHPHSLLLPPPLPPPQQQQHPITPLPSPPQACALRYLGTIDTSSDLPRWVHTAPLTLHAPEPTNAHQRWHQMDSDERACAFIAGPAPPRWKLVREGWWVVGV